MIKNLLAATLVTSLLSIPAVALAQSVPAVGSQERSWSWGTERVGAFNSKAWAARGKNVKIAIIDSGININHIEFRGALSGGYDAFTNRQGLAYVGDTLGHGTHVASLAAGRSDGRGMVGTASLSTIVPIKVFQNSSTSDAIIARGIDYARSQKAFVFNMSLGSSSMSPTIRTALQNAVKGGSVIVVAAGNEGAANPSWPARHASESWANGQIIAVGAVDQNNRIASFSNRAGATKNFYLVAPGVNLIGAYPSSTTSYAYMSGTSMAAPVVAGAVAVVKSAWPYLTAKDTANILFVTATDLGAKGVDEIYGRGLLNLEKAMLPVGKVTAVGKEGSRPLALSTSSASPVTIGAMSAASQSGILEGVVFDSFKRDFDYDFAADGVNIGFSNSVGLLNNTLNDKMSEGHSQKTATGHYRASFVPHDTDPRLNRASISYLSADGSGWAVTQGMNSLLLDRAAAPVDGVSPRSASFTSTKSLMASSASSYAVRKSLGGGLSLTAGLVRQNEDYFVNNQLLSQEEVQPSTRYELFASKVDHDLAFSAGLSVLKEERSRLGADQSSVLALAGQAQTYEAHIEMARKLSDTMTLSGRLTRSKTEAQRGLTDGMVTKVSDTEAMGYSLGLAAEHVFTKGDRIDVSLGSPLSSVSGEMDIVIATGADEQTGAPIMTRRLVSLASQKTEQRVEASYVRDLGQWKLGVAAISRFDLGGVKGRSETAGLARLAISF